MRVEILLQYLHELIELEKIVPVYTEQIERVLKAIEQDLDIN